MLVGSLWQRGPCFIHFTGPFSLSSSLLLTLLAHVSSPLRHYGCCCGILSGRDMVEIVQARGYPIQEYYPQTPDGYILGLFRIPYGRTPQGAPRQGKPVVFLQHGLLDSSWTWVNNFEQESLAFILADAGYDVWLGECAQCYRPLSLPSLQPFPLCVVNTHRKQPWQLLFYRPCLAGP